MESEAKKLVSKKMGKGSQRLIGKQRARPGDLFCIVADRSSRCAVEGGGRD